MDSQPCTMVAVSLTPENKHHVFFFSSLARQTHSLCLLAKEVRSPIGDPPSTHGLPGRKPNRQQTPPGLNVLPPQLSSVPTGPPEESLGPAIRPGWG